MDHGHNVACPTIRLLSKGIPGTHAYLVSAEDKTVGPQA